MAQYGQAFKDKALARLLPPESAAAHAVAQDLGIGVSTLERWREQAHASPARGQGWHVRAVGSMPSSLNETAKSAWWREHGVYPSELERWRGSCTTALSNPEEARASPQATRASAKRIKDLERDLLRKDRALAETAALLVLSKKVAAIFHKGAEE